MGGMVTLTLGIDKDQLLWYNEGIIKSLMVNLPTRQIIKYTSYFQMEKFLQFL